MLDQKRFTGTTQEEAQERAEQWWAKQSGLVRLSEYAGPLDLSSEAGDRWVAVIIFRRSVT